MSLKLPDVTAPVVISKNFKRSKRIYCVSQYHIKYIKYTAGQYKYDS